MAKRKYYYYEWGDEKPGYVRVWHISKNGGVMVDGEMEKSKALELGLKFWCPWS